MPSPIIRAATREDIEAFCRYPQTPTMRAILTELDGRILAMGGVLRVDGRWYAFCDLHEDMRSHKVTLVRAGKAMIDMAKAMGIKRMYTYPDPAEPRATRWLVSLGFAPSETKPALYQWTA